MAEETPAATIVDDLVLRTRPETVPIEAWVESWAGPVHDRLASIEKSLADHMARTAQNETMIAALAGQSKGLQDAVAALQTFLRGRKQWITWAGWLVAAAGAAVTHGGDAAAQLKTFLEVIATFAGG